MELGPPKISVRIPTHHSEYPELSDIQKRCGILLLQYVWDVALVERGGLTSLFMLIYADDADADLLNCS